MLLIAALTGAPKVAFTVALGVATFLVARRRLSLGLAIAVAGLAAGSSSVAWIKYTFLSARWGALFGLLAALLLLVVRRTPLMQGEALLVVLAAIPFVSCAWSIDRRLTFERAVSFAALLAVVWLLARLARGRRDAKPLYVDGLALLPVAALAASLVVLAFSSASGLRGHEFRGFFENPNGLGLFVGLTLPFLLGALDARGRGRSIVLVVAAAAVVTQVSSSRSGLLATVVGIVLYEAAGRRWRRLGIEVAAVVAVVGAALIVAAAVPSSSTTGVGSIVNRQGGMSFVGAVTGGRNEAWSATATLIGRRPVLGYGFGMGDQVFGRYPSVAHFKNFEGGLPENAYLQLVLELGLIGAAIYLVVLAAAGVGAYRSVRRGLADVADAAFAAAAGACLAALVVESVLEAAGAPWSLLAWLAFALVVPWRAAYVESTQATPAPAGGGGLSIFVTAPTNSEPQGMRSLRPTWFALGLALLAGVAIGLGAYALHDRSNAPSASSRAAADARALASSFCSAPPCTSGEVTEVVRGFWHARITTHSGAVHCYVIQLERFLIAGRERPRGTAPAACVDLPLRTQDVLTAAPGRAPGPWGTRDVAFDQQVTRVLARHLEIPRLRFVGAGKTSSADITSGVVVTPQLEKAGSLSEPYYYGHIAILARKGSPASEIDSVDSLLSLRLATFDALTTDFLRQTLHAGNVVRLPSQSAAVRALLDRNVEALAVDWTRADEVAGSSPDGRLAVVGIVPRSSYELAFRFPPRSGPLKSAVNLQIATMIADGSLARVRRSAYPSLTSHRELK